MHHHRDIKIHSGCYKKHNCCFVLFSPWVDRQKKKRKKKKREEKREGGKKGENDNIYLAFLMQHLRGLDHFLYLKMECWKYMFMFGNSDTTILKHHTLQKIPVMLHSVMYFVCIVYWVSYKHIIMFGTSLVI